MKLLEFIKNVDKEKVKNYYSSLAFTNTLLLILIVLLAYGFFSTTYKLIDGREVRTATDNNYEYLIDIQENVRSIRTAVKDITKGSKSSYSNYGY